MTHNYLYLLLRIVRRIDLHVRKKYFKIFIYIDKYIVNQSALLMQINILSVPRREQKSQL